MASNFKDLGISRDLEIILNKNGIKIPTAVQEKSIPEIVKGRDVIAQAQTGTGKTLAFLLPIIDAIDESRSEIQGLIVTPTRELAIQITNEIKKLTKDREINLLSAYGGQDVEKQINKLKKGIHIVVATPGRLLDHLRRGSLNLGKLNYLVLDEADEMLNMGFLNDISEIISVTSKKRQTMLFSATIPNEVRSLGRRFMINPVNIEIENKNVTLEQIDQLIVETRDEDKIGEVIKIIRSENPYLAMVFCRTKKTVSYLFGELKKNKIEVGELHGDLSQAKRERVIKDFREAKLQVLVATDIAARGLDIEGVTHVINYDIPSDVESYIHRIGRTGRIGNDGKAITLVTKRDEDNLAMIERKIKKEIKSQNKKGKNKKTPSRKRS